MSTNDKRTLYLEKDGIYKSKIVRVWIQVFDKSWTKFPLQANYINIGLSFEVINYYLKVGFDDVVNQDRDYSMRGFLKVND